MSEGVLAAVLADPKVLYNSTRPIWRRYRRDLRAYVEKHKPNDQPAKWETVAGLMRSKVEAADAYSDFVKASDFKSAFAGN